jgi:putative intracellular protease/amidase
MHGRSAIPKKIINNMKSLHGLLITTSNNKLDDCEDKTGVWLEDLGAPYFTLKDKGESITIASPLGGQIPLDLNSQSALAVTEHTKRFRQDAQAMYQFTHSLPLNEINTSEYDLLFLVGGYGAMWDFPDNKWLNEIIHNFHNDKKPIGLVGHAVAALVSLTTKDMQPFVKGIELTAFSNDEEATTNLKEKPPFLLETRLLSLGALYSKGPSFKNHVVNHHNIITGQNPASSTETAKKTLALAKKNSIKKSSIF